MAMNKLERIEKDIEKTKGKIAELQKQLRELEAAKTEQENLQIVQLVRGLNMTPQEFAAFVRGGALQAAPAPSPTTILSPSPKTPSAQPPILKTSAIPSINPLDKRIPRTP